jgi:hypothetical protein
MVTSPGKLMVIPGVHPDDEFVVDHEQGSPRSKLSAKTTSCVKPALAAPITPARANISNHTLFIGNAPRRIVGSPHSWCQAFGHQEV